MRRHDESVSCDAHDDRGDSVDTSAVKRIALANFVPRPNSARKIPLPIPMGTPIRLALTEQYTPEPMIALAMPPPVSPSGAGTLVKKSPIKRTGAFYRQAPCKDGPQWRDDIIFSIFCVAELIKTNFKPQPFHSLSALSRFAGNPRIDSDAIIHL